MEHTMKNSLFALILTGLFTLHAMPAQAQRRGDSPPNVTVWTDLDQRTVQNLAPATAHVEAAGKGGYLITNVQKVEDLVKFAEDLAREAGKRGQPGPRFGPQGGADPGPPNAKQAAVIKAFIGVLLGGLDLEGDGLGPGPIETEGGKWVKQCPDVGPCDRPSEPEPPEVDDCADEQRDLDLRLAELIAAKNRLNNLETLLTTLQEAKNLIDQNTNSLYWGLTLIAVVTSPATFAVTVTFMITSVTLSGIIIDKIKDLLVGDGLVLSSLIAVAQADIVKAKAALSNAQALFDMARAALDACKQAQAEAEGNYTEAFQNFLNVELPAYYACLDRQRQCIWVWIPD